MQFFRCLAKGVQALRLGGLCQLVQVVVQLAHKTGKVGLHLGHGQAQVGHHALFLCGGQQVNGDAFLHRAFVLR